MDNIEDMLDDFEPIASYRGVVVETEGLPHDSYAVLEFIEESVMPGGEYIPLEREIRRDFPLDGAIAAGVAYGGANFQLDIYSKNQYTISVLRKHEVKDDSEWREEALREIEAFKDDDG